jgi:hypothetical protein
MEDGNLDQSTIEKRMARRVIRDGDRKSLRLIFATDDGRYCVTFETDEHKT